MKHDYRDRRVGAWDWDVVNDRVVADERFAELYSVHPVLAAAGGPIAEFFRSMHHDDRAAVVAAINRAIQTREAFSEEYRLIQRDGSIRWVLAEGQCTYSDDGTPLRFPGYVFDITSRKSAEKELKADERQALLRAHARSRIWESTPDLLAAIKLDGRFQYSNPAWQHTLSWTEVDLADCSFFDLASPKGRTELITAFSEMRADDPIFRLLCKCRSKDSSYRLISWVAVLDGDLIHCIGRDVVATEMVATLSTFRDDTQHALPVRIRRSTSSSITSPNVRYEAEWNQSVPMSPFGIELPCLSEIDNQARRRSLIDAEPANFSEQVALSAGSLEERRRFRETLSIDFSDAFSNLLAS